MRSIWIFAVAIAITIGVATPAHAEARPQRRYVGVHPIPKSEGGGSCYIEGPHVHLYVADKLQYRERHGASYFVGDPVAYGYDGPRYSYKGNHPIHVEVGDADSDVEYCYLDGPHFHAAPPPTGPDFKLVGDAYFYVGAPSKPYLDARPTMVKINAVYRPLVYERPVVVVEAPVGWIGMRPELVLPTISIAPPRLDVELWSPGVYVVDRPVIIEQRWHGKKGHRHDDDDDDDHGHGHGRGHGHWK